MTRWQGRVPLGLRSLGSSLVVGATLLLVGTGVGSASTGLPSPDALPPRFVAVVTRAPSLRAISMGDFDRAIDQTAARFQLKRTPRPGEDGYEKLKKVAMGDLLDGAWIEGQAAQMGLWVTRKEVAAQLAQIKKQNFRNEAAYKAFLKASRFTQRDVNERVKLQLLSTLIQERVVRGIKGNGARLRAFDRFLAAYDRRWRSRTVCAPEYVITRCSNGPLPGRTAAQNRQ